MAVLLGGRAAEELVFGEISTGAADDLMRVTDIARSMVTRYGMDPTLGQAAYETERGSFLGMPAEGGGRRFSEETAREIDIAVRERIDRAYQRALEILRRPPRRAREPGQEAAREGDADRRRAAAADPAARGRGRLRRTAGQRHPAAVCCRARAGSRCCARRWRSPPAPASSVEQARAAASASSRRSRGRRRRSAVTGPRGRPAARARGADPLRGRVASGRAAGGGALAVLPLRRRRLRPRPPAADRRRHRPRGRALARSGSSCCGATGSASTRARRRPPRRGAGRPGHRLLYALQLAVNALSARLPLRPAGGRLHAGLRHRRPDQPRLRRDRDGRRLHGLHRGRRARAARRRHAAARAARVLRWSPWSARSTASRPSAWCSGRCHDQPSQAPLIATVGPCDLPAGVPPPDPGRRGPLDPAGVLRAAHRSPAARGLRGHDQHLAAPDPRAHRRPLPRAVAPDDRDAASAAPRAPAPTTPAWRRSAASTSPARSRCTFTLGAACAAAAGFVDPAALRRRALLRRLPARLQGADRRDPRAASARCRARCWAAC